MNPYVFHTYGLLAEASATSSSITVSLQDPGPVFTASDQLALSATLFDNGTALGPAVSFPGMSGQAERSISLSSSVFGRALLGVSAADRLELRLTVTDADGNQSTSSLFFSLDLLPAPLNIDNATSAVAGRELISFYDFADGSIATAFDPSVALPAGLFVLGRYTLTNESDLPVAVAFAVDPSQLVTAAYQEWQTDIAADLIAIVPTPQRQRRQRSRLA